MLPIRLDLVTRLVGAELTPCRVVVYQYTMDIDAILQDLATKYGIIKQQLLDRAVRHYGSVSGFLQGPAMIGILPDLVLRECDKAFVRQLIREGWSFVRRADSDARVFLFEIKITEQSCQSK
ncbi:hypothetical protein [Pseudomonas prosekii]|uniref:Uncharacterized protein n=1 Tax=Pseudomonas prosekii TaxID=1148509 RepID=A0A2U2D346_9PSED|nr:hypothetical protein [Pseudomonas prosekii]PWE41112.1 hypothetical protein C9I49_22190 [Pseudomonas prosekii]